MKNNKLYIGLIIILLCLFTTFSCSLDEVNKSAEPIGDYLKGDIQFEEFTTQVYADMRPLLRNTASMWYGTDIYEYTGVVGSWDYKINNYTLMDNNECYGWWIDNYKIITKVNTALTRANSIADLSENLFAKRRAELIALRAYAYFNLVETFSDVPLMLEDLSDNPVYEFERTSEEIIYDQIISDLKESLIDDNLQDFPNGTANFGRVGKGMVYHLLAKVLLTRSYKKYAHPDDLSKSINYALKALALHPMVDNWDILFSSSDIYNNNNSEIIFSVRYSTNQELNGGWGNNLYKHFKFEMYKFPGGGKGAPYWGRDWAFQPSEFYYSLYDESDVRGSSKYIHRTILATVEAKATIDGVVTEIKPGDPIIYFPREKWTNKQKEAYKAKYPTLIYIVNPDEIHKYIHDSNTCYPVVFKFFDPGVQQYTDDDDPRGTRDTYVFRSAETKLLLAEAYIKQGDGRKAKDLINEIRRRVNADLLVNDATLDDVLDESARELFGETNRWIELRRSGQLLSRARAHNAYVKYYHDSSDIPEYYSTRPIPEDERRLSKGKLTQNPGYRDYIGE